MTAVGSEVAGVVEHQSLAAGCMSTDAGSAMAMFAASTVALVVGPVTGPASALASALAAAPAAKPGSQSSPEFISALFLPSFAWKSPSSCLSATAFVASAAAMTASPFSGGSRAVARESSSSS